MIATPLYRGQGLGNQLANYCAVRCLALDKGYDFGVQFPENFKGASFMNLYMGLTVVGGKTSVEGQTPEILPDGFTSYYAEEQKYDGTLNVTDYDFNIRKLPDNTLVHGLLQGIGYIYHRRREVIDWLDTEYLYMPRDLCVINIRGGEYKYVPDFILPKSYFENAIELMKKKNPAMRFEIHTDDPEYAKKMFPEYEVISDIGLNWRSIRYAKNLIISNSTFAILPAWINVAADVIAPMYFAGHNVGKWSLKQNDMRSQAPLWQFII